MFKRMLAFLLAVFIIIPSFSVGAVYEDGHESYMCLRTVASEIYENNTVDISVYADCYGDITLGGIQLRLSYYYPYISYVKESAVFGEDFSSSQVGLDNGFNYAWDSVTGADLSGSDILIFTATFALAEDIEDGDYSFGLEVEELYDDKISDIYNLSYGCSVWVGSTIGGPYGIEIEPNWVDGNQVARWESNDATVATVDSNGKVKLIKKGTAVITAYGFPVITAYGFEEEVIARCKVTVHDSYGISSSEYSLEDGYITGVPPLTDLPDFLKNLQTDAGEIKVYSGEEEIKSGFAATGMTVRLYISGNVVQSFKIAVTGDINCDGECNIFDLIRIKKAASGITELDGAQLKAAGTTGSLPNAQDILRVQKQIINS